MADQANIDDEASTPRDGRVISFRLPDDAFAELAALAATYRGPGGLARELVMAAVGRRIRAQRRPAADAALLREILIAVGRLGGNANQLAHAANRGSATSAAAVAELTAELQGWRNMLLDALRDHS